MNTDECAAEFDTGFRALLEAAQAHPFKQARTYLSYGPLKAYIRIGRRSVRNPTGAQTLLVVQIANVEATEEFRGKRLFSGMLSRILALTDLPVFVENVLTSDFAEGLKRRGFLTVRTDEIGAEFCPQDLFLKR